MNVRKATIQDASSIAPLMIQAMGDICYQLVGLKDDDRANAFMKYFVPEKSNQYSYENCWVAEHDNKIVAMACVYDGALIHQLRAPVLTYISTAYGSDVHIELETQEGEIYIDCVGVDPKSQGKGFGTFMLQFLIEQYVVKQGQTLGLLVDEDNPNAKRLYLKLGFEIVGAKDFVGKRMQHLQLTLKGDR